MDNQFKNYIKIGMCKDRHQFPCDFSIYEGAIDDVTNINALEKIAKERVHTIDAQCPYAKGVVLYPSGLTQAVLTVIKQLLWFYEGADIPLVIGYWDREKQEYFYQTFADRM